MIGTTCFKLIDMIPNEMLRWINAEIPAFNDGTIDSAEGLMKYVTIGGSQFGSKIGDSVGDLGNPASNLPFALPGNPILRIDIPYHQFVLPAFVPMEFSMGQIKDTIPDFCISYN